MINVLETAQVNLGRGEYRSFSASPGHYNYLLWIYQGLNPDGFQLEVVYPRDVVPNFPAVERPTTATRYQTCTVCGVYHESCDSVTLVCARDYLAQGGTLTVTSVDRAAAGRARGSGTSVRFNEWNLASDTASGTGCIIANTIGPFDVG